MLGWKLGFVGLCLCLGAPSSVWGLELGAALKSPSPLQAVQVKVFHGRAIVLAVDAGSGAVTLDHEAIPGLMDAMTMAYKVVPKAQLAGLKKGDHVVFDVDGASYDILKIVKAP